MAAMAASLMWRGVGKCGSPAPKSTRLAPCARSLAASAATAMVAETSIRPMRSANTAEGAETVIALLSLQILRQSPSARVDFAGALQVCEPIYARILLHERFEVTDCDLKVRTYRPSVSSGGFCSFAGRR